MKCTHRFINIVIVCFIIIMTSYISADPIRFNNADSYPVFNANSHYNMLTEHTRRNIKYEDDDSINCVDEILHVSIMPFYQSASSGTDINGNNTVTDYDYSLTTTLTPTSNASAVALDNISPTQQNTTALISTLPMPLGAIPEAHNFMGLFFPWSEKDSLEPWYYNSGDYTTQTYNYDNVYGETYGNLVSKVIARALGYNHLAGVNKNTNDNPVQLTYDPLYFDYSNYRNDFFNVLSYPLSRDPSNLFGFGYFDMQYKKYGVRSIIEFRPLRDCGMRIYTGFANLDIDCIDLIDTTSNSQGPVLTHMYARYPDQIAPNNNNGQSVPTGSGLYVSPNLFSVTPYDTVPLDNNQYNTPYSVANSYFSDQFKSTVIQNIQNNIDALGRVLKQDFGPYHAQGFEDTTAEFYYRKIVLYENKDNFPMYAIMPHASVRITAPLSERILSNKIFAKPLANNGHWEYGGMIGCVFDFLQTIAVGMDISASVYSEGLYKNMPVPTKELEQGVFTYTADLFRDPGMTVSYGIGLHADQFIENTNIFVEYRFIRHAQDNFTVRKINDILQTITMQNTHRPPNVINGNNFDLFNSDPSSAESVQRGVIYLQDGQSNAMPSINDIRMKHLERLSVWNMHMINLKIKYAISDYTSFGIAWQQPFSMLNAYNSSTVGISLEMMF
jgi:hypothetical protein